MSGRYPWMKVSHAKAVDSRPTTALTQNARVLWTRNMPIRRLLEDMPIAVQDHPKDKEACNGARSEREGKSV